MMARKDVVTKALEMISSLQKAFTLPTTDETDLPDKVYIPVAYVTETVKALELGQKLKRTKTDSTRIVRMPLPNIPLLLWLDNGLIVEGVLAADDDHYGNYYFSFDSGWVANRGGRIPRLDKRDEKFQVIKWCYMPQPEELSSKWMEIQDERPY